MGFRVRTNAASMNFQHRLQKVSRESASNLGRLASGDRILSSADDPAGLAISEKMRSLIQSRERAQRNASESISLFQTAEAGMSSLQTMASRMRQLAIQSASDTNANARDIIQTEFHQLKNEMDRTIKSSSYNDIKLLDNNGRDLYFQVGVYDNGIGLDTLKLKGDSVHTDLNELNVANLSVNSKENARAALDPLLKVLDTITERRTRLGAMHSRMLNVIDNTGIANENESSSKSLIRDADIAVETAERARLSIMEQTTVNGLVHANVSQANHVAKLLS